MSKWLLPSLTGIIARATAQPNPNGCVVSEPSFEADSSAGRTPPSTAGSTALPLLTPQQTEQQWRSAVATLQDLLADQIDPQQPQTTQAVVLCGPLPLISRADLYGSMATWLFVSDALSSPCGLALQLRGEQTAADIEPACLVSVPILEQDGLAQEQFCLVITSDFGIVLALGNDESGQQRFQFSCDPQVLKLCWRSLLLRVRLSNAHYAKQLDHLFDLFAPPTPDYLWMSRFTQRMMQHFAVISNAAAEQRLANLVERVKAPLEEVSEPAIAQSDLKGLDVELLRAIAHEVRTPLATIRTMARSLLRRKDLDDRATRRLKSIDQECTEQIDRFGLIFKAVELETGPDKDAQHLAATSLDQVFQAGLPRWQNQAQRRNLSLELKRPDQMPLVVSDPNMLDQALTGLMDRFTRQLPAQSHIQVEASLAGDQLKLQFQSRPDPARSRNCKPSPPPLRKSLGKLLSLQPETGSLSLNMDATKHLFQALGGKLHVKEHQQNGEVLTVFLPLQQAVSVGSPIAAGMSHTPRNNRKVKPFKT